MTQQSTALVPQPAIVRRFNADVREELAVLSYMKNTSPEFYSEEVFQAEHIKKLTQLCADFDEAWRQHLEEHSWPLLPGGPAGPAPDDELS